MLKSCLETLKEFCTKLIMYVQIKLLSYFKLLNMTVKFCFDLLTLKSKIPVYLFSVSIFIVKYIILDICTVFLCIHFSLQTLQLLWQKLCKTLPNFT